MKVSVTKPELLALLSEYFKQTVTECVITKPLPILHCRIEEAMKKEIGQMPPLPEKKISAIKHLRIIVPGPHSTLLGLAEAKWAIENWNQWIAFIKERGRIPKLQFIDGWNKCTLS